MIENQTTQKGFSVLYGVLAVVVLCIIASAAWLTYSHYQKAHQAKQMSISASSQPATTSTTTTPTTTQPATSATSVVQIPELKIQITVPNDIKDLQYQVNTVTLKNGNQATLAMFTTKALTALDSACSADLMPLGSLEMANGQYPSDDQYATLDYGMIVKQFPTFYISAGTPNAGCSTDASFNATASKFKSEFATARSTIQQLN